MFSDATTNQLVLAATLLATVVGFTWGRIRYDMVALGALTFLAVVEIVPRGEAFSGFGHPAVVTVAAMLVISRGLENSGVVDVIARRLARFGEHPSTLVASHSTVVAATSGVMNNVGALALLMPVAMRVSRRAGHRAAIVLMPLAFASLLGGMVTLIGTPPNIVVASAREDGFAMFDFAPVGIVVAVVGVVYLSTVGWRLIPIRGEGADDVAFQIEGYLTEIMVPPDSDAVGMRIHEVESASGTSVRVLALVRQGRRIPAPSSYDVLQADDVLVVEAEADELNEFVSGTGLEFVPAHEAEQEAEEEEEEEEEAEQDAEQKAGAGLDGETLALGSEPVRASVEGARVESPETTGGHEAAEPSEADRSVLDSDEVRLVEVVVRPGSLLSGRSASGLRLRERFRVNLLAVAREGGTTHARLDQIRIRPGDVLLLQAPAEGLSATLTTLGGLPLAERGLRFNARPQVLMAILIAGLALVLTAFGVLPVEIAATLAVLGMGVAGLVTLREAYEAIDWPVLILLGAMLPVGTAIETTGSATLVADAMISASDGLPLVAVVALVLVIAMLLSDVVNNVATAVLLIPISVSLAVGLDVPVDALLMAVAVGASSAFLTPIGHQSNVLVMGPGGYRFSDYWRVGLLLEVLIVIVAAPMIVLVWG